MDNLSTVKEVVCAYCRVSTDNDAQLNSLDNQTYYFKESISKNPDYTLHRIYADEGLSATSWKRRKCFQDMLYDAGLDIEIHNKEIKAYVSNREPKFSRILIKDVSRFSRNASEGLELVSKLRQKGVHIDFVSIGLSTEQMTNDLIVGFFLLAAENDSKDKSKKIQWGKRISAEKGVVNVSTPFYGYSYLKESNELVIVKEEAEVVRWIFELYLGNHGFGSIVKKLEERNIKNKNGKRFSETSIKRMLRNPSYCGILARNRYDQPSVFSSRTKTRIRPESEWIITEDRIPPIIEKRMFDEVQALRTSKLNHKNRIGIASIKSKYSSKLVCAICGSNYTKSINKKNMHFYLCSRRKSHGLEGCNSPYVLLEQIDETIEKLASEDYYAHFTKEQDYFISQLKKEVVVLQQSLDSESIAKINVLKDELTILEEENSRLGLLFVKGKMSEEDLNEIQNDINLNKERVNQEIVSYNKVNEQIYAKIVKYEKLIEQFNALTIKTHYSSTEMMEQIEKFVVHKDEVEDSIAILEPVLKVFRELSELNKKE